jgi:protein-tyrosine phosphatase
MRILFVCAGNICRSPFAEAVARSAGHDDVESAGLTAFGGSEPTSEAVAVAGELGFDLSSHRARTLTDDMLERADVVVGMEAAHVAAIDRMGHAAKTQVLGGVDLADPYGCGPDAYRRAYARIERDVRKLVSEHA